MSHSNQASDNHSSEDTLAPPCRPDCAAQPPGPDAAEDAVSFTAGAGSPGTADTVIDMPRAAHALASVAPAAAATSPAAQRRRWPQIKPARLVRRALAAALIAAALWWLVLPFAFPISSEAVVNARIVQVRSPIDGVTHELRREIGDTVGAGDALMSVASSQVDMSHLAGLSTRRAELASRLERLTSELEQAEQIQAEAGDCTRRHQEAHLDGLQAAQQEAVARGHAALLELEAARRRMRRLEPLALAHAVSVIEFDDVRQSAALASKRVELERAALLKVEREIRAAEQGLVSSYFRKRAEEYGAKAPQLKAARAEAQQLLAAVEAEIAREEQRLAQLAKATLTSPQSGIVWKRQGGVGQVVKQNEALYEVADVATMFVEAQLHQRYLSSVGPGSRAVIQLTGGQSFNGRVRAVRTLGPADAEPAFAVNLPQRDLKQVRVLIDFDPVAPDPALIGRHARVLIVDEDPGVFQRLMAWAFSNLGG
jgi:multidrug resistance efflux pump